MSSSVYFVFGWWNPIAVLLFKKLYCCVCLNVYMCECLNVWGVKHLILILFLPNIFQNFWAKTAVKPAKNSRKLVETANNSNIIGKKQRQNRIKIYTILSPSDMFSFCSFYSAMISIYFTPSLWIFPVSHAPLSYATSNIAYMSGRLDFKCYHPWQMSVSLFNKTFPFQCLFWGRGHYLKKVW